MKQIKTHLFLLLLTATVNTYSQIAPRETPSIEVTGKAEQEFAPDEISILLNINETMVGPEKMTVEKKEEKLKKELKGLNVDLKNLVPFDPNPNSMRAIPPVNGPMAMKSYTLKLSNAAIVPKVFEQLEKLEIRGARITNQTYSKMEDAKKDTKILAMKAAKEKANYLLNAIGEQAGKAIYVKDKDLENYRGGDLNSGVANLPPGGFGPQGGFQMPGTPGMPGMGGSPEIKNIKISEEVIVKFEIK